MSTEGNDPTAGEDAGPGPTPEQTPKPEPTPDPAPTESSAAPEPPPPAPDPEPEPDPAPSPPPPPEAETTAAAPQSSAPASFDFAAVPRSVWISAGGALILLISVFLSWYTATASATLGGNTISRSASGSGWDSGNGAKFVALLALLVLVVWAIDLFADNITLPFPASMAALGLGALAFLVCLIKVFSKPGGGDLSSFNGVIHFSVSTAWGLYVAILASIAVVVGAYLHMNETNA